VQTGLYQNVVMRRVTRSQFRE